MSDIESNIDQHAEWLRDLVDDFDFTRVGKDQSLGRDLAVVVAGGIVERTVADQEDASGGTLKALSPKYKARKRRDHDVEAVGVLTGQMLSLQSVLGDVSVGPDEVTMAYGTGDRPSAYSTRGEITGDEPTDREKAAFFTEQGRPFYAIDDAIRDAIYDVASESLDEYVAEKQAEG